MLEQRERLGRHYIEELVDRSLLSCRMLALVDTVPTSCVFVCDAFYDTLLRNLIRHNPARNIGSVSGIFLKLIH